MRRNRLNQISINYRKIEILQLEQTQRQNGLQLGGHLPLERLNRIVLVMLFL